MTLSVEADQTLRRFHARLVEETGSADWSRSLSLLLEVHAGDVDRLVTKALRRLRD